MAFIDNIIPADSTTGKVLALGRTYAESGDRDARIAELEAELAEIRKQKKSLDVEADMGRYKFQYDADPSTYTNVMQSRRNAEQTEKIRKANEDATNLSMLQGNYRDNAIQLEAAKYDTMAKKQAYEAARKSGDTKNLPALNTAYKQALALQNRLERNNDYYTQQLGDMLGMPKASDEEVKGFDVDADVAGIDRLSALKGTAERLSKDYDDPGYAIKDAARKAKYEAGTRDIAQFEAEIEAAKGKVDEEARQALVTMVDDLKRKVETWKPGSKSPKRPKREMEPGDWKAAVDKKNADGSWLTVSQLVKMGFAFLTKAESEGAENPNLAKAKANAK